MLEEKLCVEDIIDDIHELLDKAWDLPLSGGKSVVPVKKLRELLEQIRSDLPTEIREAQGIVADREEIIASAKKESQDIIDRATQRAEALVAEQRVVTEAKQLSEEIINDANSKARDAKNAAVEFADSMLKRAEDEIVRSLEEIKQTRTTVRSSHRDM